MTLRTSYSFRHLNLVAVIAVAAMMATACGGDDAAVVETPPDTTTTAVESDGPTVTTATAAPMTEEQIVEMQEEIAEVVEEASPEDVPPAEIVEQIMEAVEEAAPESELSLGICTQWVTDPEMVLNEQQAQECAAMLAAAMEACEGLDCFGEGTPEPDPEAVPAVVDAPEPEPVPEPEGGLDEPTTTVATAEPVPEPEETTTTAPPDEPEETTTTAPPDEPEETTTTAPPELEPIPEPEPEPDAEEPEAEAEVETSNSDWVAPSVGLVPEVHPDTPPTSWERGDLQPGTRPIETPRSTGADRVQVAEWINWMGAQPTTYRQWLMYNMKWALDYLGAHPACVIPTYYERVVTSNEVTLSGQAEPTYLTEQYGWHNCATVIDPFIPGVDPPARANDIGLRLSDTPGITLAERCQTVLPEDIQLEGFRFLLDEDGNRIGEADHYGFDSGHDGCDDWANWVESGYWYPQYPTCTASAQLAEEWMEHHYGAPEINVTC